MKKEVTQPKSAAVKNKPKASNKHAGAKKPARKKPPRKRSVLRSTFWVLFGTGFTAGVFILLVLTVYGLSIDKEVRTKFEGHKWEIPAQAYARPLELYPGKLLSQDELLYELDLLGYIENNTLKNSGTYRYNAQGLELHTREFQFWDSKEAAQKILIQFQDKRVSAITTAQGEEAFLARIDPVAIGSFYPGKGEDRTLIKLTEVPEIIPQTLITVEDKAFYYHFGINPLAIVRAALVNLKAGRTVQGGSTITQQLAKNFYLNSERSFMRKIKEAVTAILLEIHYSKKEIIEAYLNEVYMAQNGQREVHGIAMASFYYFGRHPKELTIAQTASLIALLKAPTSYNPRRYPERALKRRNLIIGMLEKDQVITPEQATLEKARPLRTIAKNRIGNTNTKYPAFMDVVKQQLLEDYKKEALQKSGIKVFTTFNPLTQRNAELSVADTLPKLDKLATFETKTLESALVISQIETGEIEAVVGGRTRGLAGFNRALDARRPIGSLIKPLIYLAALERADQFTLASLLNDVSVTVNYPGGTWTPKNYDKKPHNKVLLVDALAKSYNLATARLGLKVGIPNIVEKLRTFGFKGDVRPYPSLLLGAVNMSPVQVSQYYLTLANKGFNLPLRAIRSVINQDGEPLKSYDLRMDNVVDIKTAYLTYTAMRRVVTHGTARKINAILPPSLGIAGKTGTTNEYRDSWFAGFSGNYLTVSWIGRDDNKPSNLSGTKGALTLWIDAMKRLNLVPYTFNKPIGIEHALVNSRTGQLSQRSCKYGTSLPFVAGTSPFITSYCTAKDERIAQQKKLQKKKEKEVSLWTEADNKKAKKVKKAEPEQPKKRTAIGDFFRSIFGKKQQNPP